MVAFFNSIFKITPFFQTLKTRVQFLSISCSSSLTTNKVLSNMYKSSVTSLESISKDDFRTFFNSFDTVLFDCDGVLWIENDEIPGSVDTVVRLKQLGKQVFFVTNNSTKTRKEFAEKAANMGYPATEDNILSTAFLTANYLKSIKFSKKVYIVGSKGVSDELDAVGIKNFGVGPDVVKPDYKSMQMSDLDPKVGAVVVGFDEHISYPKLMKAATYLRNPDCIFIGTNTDERFPKKSGIVIPGTGTLVRAVQTCAERDPLVVGKPNEYVRDYLTSMGINPDTTIMVGDRINTDIELGARCGYQTLLVLSGVTSPEDLNNRQTNNIAPLPDVYLPSLKQMLPLLPKPDCDC